jgi:hypothetical protein
MIDYPYPYWGTPDDYPYPVWGTQGGGLVRRSGNHYIFVEKPDCHGLDVGDAMPEEWAIASANNAAREEMNQVEEDFDNDPDVAGSLHECADCGKPFIGVGAFCEKCSFVASTNG